MNEAFSKYFPSRKEHYLISIENKSIEVIERLRVMQIGEIYTIQLIRIEYKRVRL